MKNFPRMYVVTSNQLNKGKACAQACHGLAAFQEKHPSEFDEWSNYYIVCLKGNLDQVYEKYVVKVLDETKKDKVEHRAWPKAAEYREPDMDNTVTCMVFCALNEQQLAVCEEMFKDLPLV